MKSTVTVYVLPWQLENWKEVFESCEGDTKPKKSLETWFSAPFGYSPEGTLKCQISVPIDTFVKFEELKDKIKK